MSECAVSAVLLSVTSVIRHIHSPDALHFTETLKYSPKYSVTVSNHVNGTLGSLGGPGSRFHSQLLGQDLLFIAPGVIIHFSWLHYLTISEKDGCISRLVRWIDECIFRQPKTMDPVYGSNTIA